MSIQDKVKTDDTPEKLTEINMKTFVKKYEKDKWLAAASRHYDITGRRISAEAAKKLYQQ